MDIGKTIRTITVEPVTTPVPERTPTPAPTPERTPEPVPEREKVPA